MTGLSIYLLNLGLLSFISLFFLLIGQQLQQTNKLTFRTTFFSLFVGILFLSTGFAMVKTGGKTIMLGFVLLALFYFFEKKQHSTLPKKHPQSSPRFLIIGLLFGAFFVFTWAFLAIGQFDAFPYHIPSGTQISQNDYLINVVRSYYLGVTGEENYYHFFNTVDAAYHGPKPYHYLEMWTTAGLTSIFGGLAAEKFTLLTTPLYHLTAFVGILALWEKYQAIKWYHLVLSAAFLFFAGLHFQFYEQWKILNFSLPIFTHRVKMCTYYPFIFAFLLQFDKERPQRAILLLMGLIIATVVVAPALLGGIGLFLVYQFFVANNKFSASRICPDSYRGGSTLCNIFFSININKKNVLKTAGYAIATALFVFLFYKFTETGQFNIRANAGTNSVVTNLLISLTTTPLDKLITLFTILLKEAILYLPLLLVTALLFSSDRTLFANHFTLFVLVIGMVLSGAAVYTLLKGQKDATQLFYNIVNATLNCLLIWAVIKLISQLPKAVPLARISWKYYGIGLVLLVLFVKQVSFAVKRNIYPAMTTKKYSDDYLQQIKAYVLTDDSPNIGAAIKGGKDYNSGFSKQTAAYTLGYYLAYMENGAIALNISDFDIPNLKWGDELDRASNLFCRFVKTQNEDKTFVSIGQSQVEFIQKYELDFIILSKNGTLREEVETIVHDRIVDVVSGERFLLVQ